MLQSQGGMTKENKEEKRKEKRKKERKKERQRKRGGSGSPVLGRDLPDSCPAHSKDTGKSTKDNNCHQDKGFEAL